MTFNHWLPRVILTTVMAFSSLASLGKDQIKNSQNLRIEQQLPDFHSIENIHERKRRFFNYLRPLTEKALEEVSLERQKLLQISRKNSLTREDIQWLKKLSKKYRIHQDIDQRKNIDWNVWLERVDIVPMELILAQAANESAWGTSRFARNGNNLFGQWCYRSGCGMIPTRRIENAAHEVAVFKTPEDSIRAYLLNINRHRHYQSLRQIRSSIRKQGKPLIAEALALGLQRYSEKGENYVKTIQKMIRVNRPLMLGQLAAPS